MYVLMTISWYLIGLSIPMNQDDVKDFPAGLSSQSE